MSDGLGKSDICARLTRETGFFYKRMDHLNYSISVKKVKNCFAGNVCIPKAEVLQRYYHEDTTTGHYLHTYLNIYIYLSTGPDSSSGRASASRAVGRGLES